MASLPDLHTKAAVATLIATEGSSPRRAGARMWVDEDGAIVGSVTIGGCVDARVIEESSGVIAGGASTVLSMALGDEDAWALGMTCAGSVQVLVEPVDPGDPADPVGAALRAADAEVAAGGTAIIVVPLEPGETRLVLRPDGTTLFPQGRVAAPAVIEAAGASAADVSGTRTLEVDGARRTYYFERHAPPLTLVIFGATHVAQPLSDLARVLGLRVVVVDGRERYASPARFPNADEVLVGMPSEVAAGLSLGANSLVVLLAHDYKYDLPVLRAVLGTDAAYVGVLGSARRGRALLDFLAEEGMATEQLRRVRVPIGLDLGAHTAAEIALSVLAEALAVHRGRNGGPMQDRARSRPA
jgi:xanthine dehydrogenase accessory factor